MFKRFVSLLGLFLAVAIVFFIVRSFSTPARDVSQQMLPTVTLRIGDATFRVEIADDVAKQAQGLSGRAALGESEGMLFVFPEPGNHTFWMKDMQFPLDFVWIRGGTVVGVTENALPEGVNPALTYGPPEAVDRVLEVNAGIVTKYRIASRDTVTLK